MNEATGGRAWAIAFASVERALADAEEQVGVIPAGSAAAIVAAADRVDATVDVSTLRTDGEIAGTPVVPFVRALRDAAGEAGEWVHHGATSQDIIDTSLALVSRQATEVLSTSLHAIESELAALIDQHRAAPMMARTLLQHAEPMTFGAKAARWLLAVVDAHTGVIDATAAMPAQLGGAAGSLAALGASGPDVVDRFAAYLGLPAPVAPWHTRRAPVAKLAGALGIVTGTVAKMAGDIVLLAQTEVGEVAERSEPGRGMSSAMPHKRNPVASVAAIAAARRAAPLAQALVVALDHEHERAAGAWQAEAPMVCDLFRLTGLAADRLRDALDGLTVDTERMRANLGDRAPQPGQLDSVEVFIDRALAAFRERSDR